MFFYKKLLTKMNTNYVAMQGLQQMENYWIIQI